MAAMFHGDNRWLEVEKVKFALKSSHCEPLNSHWDACTAGIVSLVLCTHPGANPSLEVDVHATFATFISPLKVYL
jgi:hypothetical protein